MTLKIQRSFERKSIVLTLTGRIQADQLPDLQALLGSESPNVDIVVDLSHIKLVDRDAVQFLARREAAGTELRNCSAYIREWIRRKRMRWDRKERNTQQTQQAKGIHICGLYD